MQVVTRLSPNQSDRLFPGDVRLIVCHTPEGSYQSALATCLNPNADVSYHLLIRKDGTEATQLVPWERKAWHAGPVNSLSDGISIEGHARHFSLLDKGAHEMSQVVAERLIARKLKPQWTTDIAEGGFCRHGDLQTNRTDPTPDLEEWKVFVGMVQADYQRLTKVEKPWPVPVPAWFWVWARWRLGVAEFKQFGPANPDVRPKEAPPPGISWAPGGKHHWAYRRLRALVAAQKAAT